MKLIQILSIVALMISINVTAMKKKYSKFNDEDAIVTFKHKKRISKIAITPDEQYIVITHPDDTCEILGVDNGLRHCFGPDDYNDIIESLEDNFNLPNDDGIIKALSPNNEFIVKSIKAPNKGCQKSLVRILDAKTEGKVHTLTKWYSKESIDSIAITPDNNLIITNHTIDCTDTSGETFGVNPKTWKYGKIMIWKAETGKHMHSIKKLPFLIKSLAMSLDGSFLVIGYGEDYQTKRRKNGSKETINIIQISSRKKLFQFSAKILKTKNEIISSIAISATNKFIVIGYKSGLIKIINIDL